MSFELSRSEPSLPLLGAATAFVVGFCTHAVVRRLFPGQPVVTDFEDDDEEYEGWEPAQAGVFEEHKLVLCVRTDLKMQKGKIAAQVGHATLGAYKGALRRNSAALRHWERNAQPKIALQISSRAEARRLEQEARRRGLVTFMVHDAGRTQIAAVGRFVALYMACSRVVMCI